MYELHRPPCWGPHPTRLALQVSRAKSTAAIHSIVVIVAQSFFILINYWAEKQTFKNDVLDITMVITTRPRTQWLPLAKDVQGVEQSMPCGRSDAERSWPGHTKRVQEAAWQPMAKYALRAASFRVCEIAAEKNGRRPDEDNE